MSIFLPVMLVLVVAIVALMTRWIEAGLVCLLAVQLCNATFGPNAMLVGPLHLSALDAVSVSLLTAGALRFTRNMRVITAPRLVAVGYGLLFVWSFARGYAANGLLAAANETRGFVGPLVAMLYFADAPVALDSLCRYLRWYLLFAGGLSVVGALAVAGLPVGVTAWAHPAAELADHRVLPSSVAAILAICGFIALARSTFSVHTLTAHLWPATFFLAAVYLRHRTVWVMLLTGMVAIGFLDRRLFRRIMPMMLLAVAGVVGLVLIQSDQFDVASQNDFAESLSNTETWQWRLNGWREFLIDPDQTTLTAIAGKPMGNGWWRIDPESHLLQTAPPHSEYVTEYLRVGVVGLVLIMTFAVRPIIALAQIRCRDNIPVYPSAAIWQVIALMALVYGATYSIEPEMYALMGLANALANHARAPEHSSSVAPDDSTTSFTFAH